MNHDLKVENTEVNRTWDTMVSVEFQVPDLELTESIKDELDLMVWVLLWEFKRDSLEFHFP